MTRLRKAKKVCVGVTCIAWKPTASHITSMSRPAGVKSPILTTSEYLPRRKYFVRSVQSTPLRLLLEESNIAMLMSLGYGSCYTICTSMVLLDDLRDATVSSVHDPMKSLRNRFYSKDCSM
jgi:hypothetical protein